MKKNTLVVLEALAHPARIKMLAYMANKERRPAELAKHVKINESSIAHHFKTLRLANLVDTRSEGRAAFHRLNKDILRTALEDIWVAADLDEEPAE